MLKKIQVGYKFLQWKKRAFCISNEEALTWSDSHSRVQVLIASTHRLGFTSLGQRPACEYASFCKAMPLTRNITNSPAKNNHIHRRIVLYELLTLGK